MTKRLRTTPSLHSIHLSASAGKHTPWQLTPRQTQTTPLYIAAQNGHVEVARLLVEAKADVDAREEVVKGWSKVHTSRWSPL